MCAIGKQLHSNYVGAMTFTHTQKSPISSNSSNLAARRRPLLISFVAALFMVFTCVAPSGASAVPFAKDPSNNRVATTLVNKMWTLAQTNDQAGLETFINKGFQAQDADQPRWNKKQFINVLVNGEKLSDYTLSDLRATRTGQTIVVTYMAAADQIVNGKTLSGEAKPRLTVFVQSPKTKKYTVISHSSFNVVPNS